MLGFLIAMSMMQDPIQHKVPLPSANQMAWHARQYYAFVHFGPNTFSGNEWGHGDEDPSSFNPSELDCRQWCHVFKEAGMSGVIITAKHHDGFALWPSKLTTHSVASSKWRDGGGDVLKELSAACKEYGLWMGVYLSPWDRNHPAYGTEAYNDVFVGMLREVLTQYGDIKEVWFDGANGEGPNGKRQVYDWERYEATVREFAPNAVIFGDGGDVRWVGNESGFVGETNWNFLPSGHWPGDQSIYHLLFEGDPVGDKYSPAECDVSIRPGWFWRASENGRVKSLSELKDIYYRSIGHGANLLLNVPPDTRGLIHENDVAALMKFKKWQDATFGENLSRRAWASASESRFGHGPKAINSTKVPGTRSFGSNWSAKFWTKSAAVALNWSEPRTFDHIVVQEYAAAGQRIKKFHVEINGKQVASGTTVGYKRIVTFPAVTTQKVRFVIDDSLVCPTIWNLEAHLGAPSVAILTPESTFLVETTATLRSETSGAEIRYTTDGSEPTSSSPLYKNPIRIDKSCNLKARAFYKDKSSMEPAVMVFRKWETEELLPATVFIKAPEPGLAYTYFEQGWQTLNQMKDAVATSTGVAPDLGLGIRKRDEHFGLQFHGVISVPADGIYTYDLESDDGSRLWIDDKLVIDNDGLHGMQSKRGVVGLRQGYHRVRIEYFNAGGGMGLTLSWKVPGFDMRQMVARDFSH